MGKAKKRNFNKCVKAAGIASMLPVGVSRVEAISFVVQKVKENKVNQTAKDYISLFGITAEELSEAGAGFEALLALKHLFI